MGLGDPACDLMAGWAIFGNEARARFREAAPADAASLARGRNWALSFGLMALAYYRERNLVLSAIACRAISAA